MLLPPPLSVYHEPKVAPAAGDKKSQHTTTPRKECKRMQFACILLHAATQSIQQSPHLWPCPTLATTAAAAAAVHVLYRVPGAYSQGHTSTRCRTHLPSKAAYSTTGLLMQAASNLLRCSTQTHQNTPHLTSPQRGKCHSHACIHRGGQQHLSCKRSLPAHSPSRGTTHTTRRTQTTPTAPRGPSHGGTSCPSIHWQGGMHALSGGLQHTHCGRVLQAATRRGSSNGGPRQHSAPAGKRQPVRLGTPPPLRMQCTLPARAPGNTCMQAHSAGQTHQLTGPEV